MALKISHLLTIINENFHQLKKLGQEKRTLKVQKAEWALKGQLAASQKKLEDMGTKHYVVKVRAYVPYTDTRIDCFYAIPKIDPLGNTNEVIDEGEIELLVRWHFKIKREYPFSLFEVKLFETGKNLSS